MRNAAALSFYALFSIAPIVLLATYIAGTLASDINFQREITEQFSCLVGDRAAQGVEVLLSTLDQQEQTRFQLVVGVAILVFSATNIFGHVQNTFNEIYQVQPIPSSGVIKHVIDRVVSLGIIISLGFLLIVSLVIDSLVLAFHNYLFELLDTAAVIVVQALQMLVCLITAVIYAMFHILPDVYLPRRRKLQGTLVVAVMLLLGKYGIGLYIGNSRLSELGGASASVLILMLWIYYTSIILFFGAQVIRVMADMDGVYLEPRRYVARVRTVIVGDPKSEHEKWSTESGQ